MYKARRLKCVGACDIQTYLNNNSVFKLLNQEALWTSTQVSFYNEYNKGQQFENWGRFLFIVIIDQLFIDQLYTKPVSIIYCFSLTYFFFWITTKILPVSEQSEPPHEVAWNQKGLVYTLPCLSRLGRANFLILSGLRATIVDKV